MVVLKEPICTDVEVKEVKGAWDRTFFWLLETELYITYAVSVETRFLEQNRGMWGTYEGQ